MSPTTSSGTPLTRALVITYAMLVAAQGADWTELQRLEEIRRPLLHQQHPADEESRAQVGQVLTYDRQVQALVVAARDAVAREWQGERGRVHAIAAYAQS
ncbi:hypothetical protein ACVWWQ_001117 [Rhodanobacter sp. TND4EL1]